MYTVDGVGLIFLDVPGFFAADCADCADKTIKLMP
jgi:hypothetical protein